MNSNTKIHHLVNQMLGIEGIIDVMAFDSTGDVLASRALEGIHDAHVTEMCAIVSQMVESVGYLGVSPGDIVYNFCQNRLLIKQLDDDFILVISELSKDLSALNLEITTLFTKLASGTLDTALESTADSGVQDATPNSEHLDPNNGNLSQGTVILDRENEEDKNLKIKLKPDKNKIPVPPDESEGSNPRDKEDDFSPDDGFIFFG